MTESAASKKSKRKKKSKATATSQPNGQPKAVPRNGPTSRINAPTSLAPPPPPPPPLATTNPAPKATHAISRDRIWDTSTQEERERIKEFWLSLSEEERRSLVKVEKEAVLRKMKEQQKHSCSCTVCGRKRTAIEEELEVLYDAYYQELEQYANNQQTGFGPVPHTMPPPRRFGPLPNIRQNNHIPLPKGRVQELPDDEEEEEDYSDEDDEEDYSEEEAEADAEADAEAEAEAETEAEARGPAADFFNFGNSLTVQGGILTVADDLLKNDGKKFIEMMEQLAERRMRREEEAHYAASSLAHSSLNVPGQNSQASHNHPPLAEDEEYDEDEEEEYDSQDEEEFEEDEMDAMTEEQRMEEGRRMFQIFAARMFEQRVLTAYREKVAQERQKKLLEELEEENRLDVQREQKRAKEAQKKKDKKRQQKLAKDEERARKEAERAAEEAAARALEERKAEEQRLKREEQRKKKEAERKAQEEERLRKEAEKQKRLQEERERQAEQERKHREQKDREKKRKEEAKKKERDEREAKEKELKEKREHEEREKREKEAKAKAELAAKERARKEELTAQQAAALASSQAASQAAKRLAQAAPSLSVPPGLQPQPHLKPFKSPQLQIALPAVPKAPAAVRARQASQQGSVASSPKTPQGQTRKGQSVSPSNTSQQGSPASMESQGKPSMSQNFLHQSPPPSSAVPGTMAPPPGMPVATQSGFAGPFSSAINNAMTNTPQLQPGLAQQRAITQDGFTFGHQQPLVATQYRGFVPTGVAPGQPGPSALGSALGAGPPGRGLFAEGLASRPRLGSQVPPFGSQPAQAYGVPRDAHATHSHSRQQSFDALEGLEVSAAPLAPISKPAPIQRPSSVARPRANGSHDLLQEEMDDLSGHLGSSALVDSNDEPLTSEMPPGRRASTIPIQAPGRPRTRYPFGSMYSPNPNLDAVAHDTPNPVGHPWSAGPSSYTASSLPRYPAWPSFASSSGWSSSATAFGAIGAPARPSLSRPVNIRLLIVQACKQLSQQKKDANAFHELSAVLRQVEQIRPPGEPPVQMAELLEICETEGDAQNGGGYFTIKSEGPRRTLVRHEAGGNMPGAPRGSLAPGEIGSPIPGSTAPSFGGAGGGGGGGGGGGAHFSHHHHHTHHAHPHAHAPSTSHHGHHAHAAAHVAQAPSAAQASHQAPPPLAPPPSAPASSALHPSSHHFSPASGIASSGF